MLRLRCLRSTADCFRQWDPEELLEMRFSVAAADGGQQPAIQHGKTGQECPVIKVAENKGQLCRYASRQLTLAEVLREAIRRDELSRSAIFPATSTNESAT